MRLEGEPRCLEQIALGHNGLREAELRRLAQPGLQPYDGSDLPGEADLAQDDDFAADRTIHITRCGGDHDGKVRRRLDDAPAASHVEEHILIDKLTAQA